MVRGDNGTKNVAPGTVHPWRSRLALRVPGRARWSHPAGATSQWEYFAKGSVLPAITVAKTS